ncbi:MAG: pseudouridine-5'-phosphate glycosidase [Alphaproteobacteria bacterium]
MIELDIAEEVRTAIADGRPVVALESTVIAHGLPYPTNVETALAMEAAVRAAGAVPATIAILAGRPTYGLTADDIEVLAKGGDVRKASRRDMPLVLGTGADAATTVAGTMMLAQRVGIDVFATGGIGGVHRGAPGDPQFDISADLTELARTPVCVICAGAKAILDLPATLEVLETQGVPVIGLGTDELPAFYSRSSGLPVPGRVDDAAQAAEVLAAWRELADGNGMLITVPVPADSELPAQEVERAVMEATREAASQGISGAAVTPFVLDRVAVLTDGRSLRANAALLHNNARAAAEIAVAAAHPVPE